MFGFQMMMDCSASTQTYKRRTYQIKNYPLDFDLGSQKIMSLYEDSFGFIWIGTFGKGIIRFDPKTGRQSQITEQDGLVNGNVLSIKGNENDIWFATLGGVSKYKITETFQVWNLSLNL